MTYLRKVELHRKAMKDRDAQERRRGDARERKLKRKGKTTSTGIEPDRYLPIRDGKNYRCAYCWNYLEVPKGILQRLKRLLTSKRPRHNDLTCPRAKKIK